MAKKSKNLSQFYRAGEIIFKTNEKGSSAFIVEEGEVEIFTGSEEKRLSINVLKTGEIFGEMAIIDNSPRSASAIARTNCVLTEVSKAQLADRVERSDPIVRLLMSILFSRMRDNLSEQQAKVIEIERPKPVRDPVRCAEVSGLFDSWAEGALKTIRLESELLDALETGGLQLHYQPIVNLSDYSTVGFEALVRWYSETRGLVRPDVFMGVAEETSLIVPIGRWVAQQACRSLADFTEAARKQGLPDPFMSINVSGRQIEDPTLIEIMLVELNSHGLKPEQVKIELTERVLVEGEEVVAWMDQCQENGFVLSLDDFGTGFSSLNFLSQFNVDNLKIDQSFVRKMMHEPRSNVIVNSILEMARGIGMDVVAEGIESWEEAEVLTQMGCEYGQGYLFGKPKAKDEALERLKDAPMEPPSASKETKEAA